MYEESLSSIETQYQVITGSRNTRESATENIPPVDLVICYSTGKGEMVMVRAHRICSNTGSSVNPTGSKVK